MTLLLLLQVLTGSTVDSLANAQQFSGVVLIARNGVAVVERAYGMADREASPPRRNDIETAFNLGSINKLFTQIAIRQLEAQGKLSTDSSLGRYWPDFPDARRMTIRQLLDHRSGIGGNIFAAPASGKRSDLRKLGDFLPLFINEPRSFEPGARQEYSNAGYVVLGLLIERLSGENYYDYVRRHVYEPAGMTRTAHWTVDSLPVNTAIGYTTGGEGRRMAAEGGVLTRNTDLLPGRGSSAGGGYSTARDLLRLMNALRAGKIANGGPSGIAIAGGGPGINAALEGDLEGGWDIIVLSNSSPPAAMQMVRALRGRIAH